MTNVPRYQNSSHAWARHLQSATMALAVGSALCLAALPARPQEEKASPTAIGSSAQAGQFSAGRVQFKNLVTFDGSDGAAPFEESLVQGRDGNLYGTTIFGGASGDGVAFKMTPTGGLTDIYDFCAEANCIDGINPHALTLGINGDFYGTTQLGGTGLGCPPGITASCGGTVFRITPEGALTTLYSFCSQPGCTDGFFGEVRHGALVQATDGNFYGTTDAGGANTSQCGGGGCGTVFRITPEGALKTLYSFCSQTNCDDGSEPVAGLIQGTDGDLYGTTSGGGAHENGTVFKVTREGRLTTLYSFCSQANCDDGSEPFASLVQGTDGDLYGTTLYGGANNAGTVFKIGPEGKLATLHSFCSLSNCADGSAPSNPLLLATDGNLYGTAESGGNSGCTFPGAGCGTVFKITPEGKLTTLHSFDGTDGNGAEGLVQATNGTFYGMTDCAGTAFFCFLSSGTVFSLSVGLGPFVETVPTSGGTGTKVTILGFDLAGATSVRFNGEEADFEVVSATEIRATVPSDAKTGFVKVHTPKGTLKSNVEFQVDRSHCDR